MGPLTVVGKIVGRTDDGKPIVEFGSDVDSFHIEEGDSFITAEVTPGGWLALFGTEPD